MPVAPDAPCLTLPPKTSDAKGVGRGSPSGLSQQGPACSTGRIASPSDQVLDQSTIIRRLARKERAGSLAIFL